MVTDAKTTFNYNFVVYCGEDPNFEHLENLGVATGAIIRLAQNLHGKGHIVFTLCYYTSLEYLRKVDMAGCGTVQKNCAAERKVDKRQQSVSTQIGRASCRERV